MTLLNTAPHDVSLAGWALLDTQKARMKLSGSMCRRARRSSITVQPPVALSNKGGVITLVDEKGLKVRRRLLTPRTKRRTRVDVGVLKGER